MYPGYILVVDDQETEAQGSIRVISRFAAEDRIFYASSAAQMMQILEEQTISLVFLDIDMPGSSGFSIAEYLERKHGGIPYVFLTGYANFAAESYDHEPLDFLTKPLDPIRLSKTFDRLASRENKERDLCKIAVESDQGLTLLDPASIVYIVREGRKIRMHCLGGKVFAVNYSMDELELILVEDGFFRNHQSYLIDLGKIVSVKPSAFGSTYEAVLQGGITVPVSRNKYAKLKELLLEKGVRFM